jgi:tRNA (adenine-N(1)-)-methyltransferase non-catalytic subunit
MRHSTISLGKYGSFQSNLVLGRPYHLTYELLDKQEGQSHGGLRIVPAAELHADMIAEEEAAANGSHDDRIIIGGDGVEFELVGENGEVMMRSNREIIDDTAAQTLTMKEIEALKRDGANAGKELIAKLMLSHTAIDQKTTFSLAKYKLLKTKKYLRRFTILPLDVPLLTQWLIEDKDPGRIMEMREEMLALAGCWANVHFGGYQQILSEGDLNGGRWLVVDEVGGLLVAAMAERMGILYPKDEDEDDSSSNGATSKLQDPRQTPNESEAGLASTNTITLIHNNAEPNLSLLKYLKFTPNTPPPGPPHPLTNNLLPISWLQLISPLDDATYATPPPSATPETIQSWKSGKRGTYYRKRRRYFRTRAIVDSTRAGSFDGLLIASRMDPISILQHLVPLLRGGAPIAIYSPTIEPLSQLADMYSMSRRTAFITSPPTDFLTYLETPSNPSPNPDSNPNETNPTPPDPAKWPGNADFPLNPTLLLGVNIQTSKIRKWQVLPGRTHPHMTGRGGAEGYLFTATRVIPAEGRVEARGRYTRALKRRKMEAEGEGEGRDEDGEGEGKDEGDGEAKGSQKREVVEDGGIDDVGIKGEMNADGGGEMGDMAVMDKEEA